MTEQVKPATDAEIEGMWIDMSHSTGKTIKSLWLRIDEDRAKIAALEATLRGALGDATLAEYMVNALDGEASDFAQSFEPVRRVMDLNAENASLREQLQVAESTGGRLREALKRAAIALRDSEEFDGSNRFDVDRINRVLEEIR